MWQGNWRDEVWERLRRPWDLIVVGGGIAGAGVLREAGRLGLKAVLLEQRDFAWGTSSRSSKLVHGGLRYLMEGKFGLTRACVKERNRLITEAPGLIEPLDFLLASYGKRLSNRWIYALGLSIYDVLSLKWEHRFHPPVEFCRLAPHLSRDGLQGGFSYGDAETDDARLVLRVIREAVADGGAALNYASVEVVLRRSGEAIGVRVRDRVRNRTAEVFGKAVVNAAGAWADRLRGKAGGAIRPLRGSHLVLPSLRLPVAQAITFRHPDFQGRHVFAFPWEGASIVGTTDLDHERPLEEEPAISPEEADYLMSAVQKRFPSLGLSPDAVLSTYAGVRPVLGTGRQDPSKESRGHAVWAEEGLVTVTGGKLTTFRLVALDALRAVRRRLPNLPSLDGRQRILAPAPQDLPAEAFSLDERFRRRLAGRYALDAPKLAAAAKPGELTPVPGTPCLWAEIRWAARSEGVVHLDDLLLRRVRLGLVAPEGAVAHLERIRAICREELEWDAARWEKEKADYLALWRKHYSMPGSEGKP